MKLNISGKEVEVSDEELSKAIEDKATSFEVKSDFVIRTKEEDDTFKSNIQGLNNDAAIEIGRKEFLKGIGIESNGQHKSLDLAVAAFKDQVSSGIALGIKDAKIEPNDKITGLEADKVGLLTRITELESGNTKLQGEFGAYKQDQTRKNTLSGLVSDKVVNKSDYLILFNAKVKTGFTDNVLHGINANGDPMKDKNMSLMPMSDVMAQFDDANPHLLKQSSGGAGGDDSTPPGTVQGLASFNAEMKEKDIYLQSPEYIKIRDERIKLKTLSFE